MLARGMTDCEARVAAAILCNYPHSKPAELIEHVWPDPDEEPDWARSVIYHMVYDIRRNADKYGIDIPRHRKGAPYGYGLRIKLKFGTIGHASGPSLKVTNEPR